MATAIQKKRSPLKKSIFHFSNVAGFNLHVQRVQSYFGSFPFEKQTECNKRFNQLESLGEF